MISHLESEVKEYRDQRGKALSVSGPSKSGKTVLIEQIFTRKSSIWVEGADLTSTDRFWHRLADGLDAYDRITVRGEQAIGNTDESTTEGGIPALRLVDKQAESSQLTKSKEDSQPAAC